MSGKAVVGVLAVLALGALVFGLWFVGSRSPVDQRFNYRRQALSPTASQSQLLPDRVGDFLRQSLTPLGRSSANQLTGSASYADTDHKKIWLQVRSLGDSHSGSEALDAFAGKDFTFHKDAVTPYGYGTTQDGYTFAWVNNGWLLEAFTSETDAEALLQFVNGYPY